MARVLFSNTREADVNKRSNAEAVVCRGFAFSSTRLFWSLSFLYASFIALLLQRVLLHFFSKMHTEHRLLMKDAMVCRQRFLRYYYHRTVSLLIKSLKVLDPKWTKWPQIETFF